MCMFKIKTNVILFLKLDKQKRSVSHKVILSQKIFIKKLTPHPVPRAHV